MAGNTETDNRGLCIDCGRGIAVASVDGHHRGVPVKLTIDRCKTCAFAEGFRRRHCCSCPYERPCPRPMADGTIPPQYIALIEAEMEKEGFDA